MNHQSYRDAFASETAPAEYESGQYGASSYSSVLWELEKQQLGSILERLRQTHSHIDYLDFATGTGRVLSYLEPSVDTAEGIEISVHMAAAARLRVTRATVTNEDITDSAPVRTRKYDLITAFRFFLNAEHSLRLAAMKALAARLRDASSVFVFNNHGNPFSYKLPAWPVKAVRARQKPGTSPNWLTNWQVRELAAEAGLSIESQSGCGFLSAKAGHLLSSATVLASERRLAGVGWLQPVAVNQLYVARLR
jgi:Methyltransferase domain